MELSHYIQSPELFGHLARMRPEQLRKHVLQLTHQWYAQHPDDTAVIADNVRRFGLTADQGLISDIAHHIGLHYFEKLVGLCGGPEIFHAFLDAHVNAADAAEIIASVRNSGKGILLAAPHFGGVELIAPSLSMRRTTLTAALRFKTEQLSRSAHDRAQAMADTGLFSPISFIEVGRPGTRAALDMAAVLRRGETLLSVFDEKTDYSVEVALFGRRVWGGAGLDKLIAFAGASCAVFAAFMTRTNDGMYQLSLDSVEPGDSSIAHMYAHLEQRVREHPEQWYFLHEEIPFVEES